MDERLTHASFFSGVGGLDLGLERAGWRTVSFSEIDPYASAVLAERWPGVPNLGDITTLTERHTSDDSHLLDGRHRAELGSSAAWRSAALWTGGFPCQDLSIAGKRRGMGEGTRSGLAFAFLDLAAVHRPRGILLENVPGLLSSHGGRDMAALLGALVELGYGVAYRILDARYFGVPQRRRRVFILGLRSDPDDPGGRVAAERAAEVLSVGTRCDRHPATGHQAGEGAAERATPGVDIARAVTGTSGKRHDDDTDTLIANGLRASDGHHGYGSPRGDGGDNLVAHSVRPRSGMPQGWNANLVSSSPDPRGVRASDGLAGGPHDRQLMGSLREHVRPGSNTDYTVVQSLDTKQGGPDDNEAQAGHLVYRKATKAHNSDDWERWERADMTDTLSSHSTVAATLLAPGPEGGRRDKIEPVLTGDSGDDDPLLPLGLDSHRYRCCGNGVVAPVSEWIGHRLAAILEEGET